MPVRACFESLWHSRFSPFFQIALHWPGLESLWCWGGISTVPCRRLAYVARFKSFRNLQAYVEVEAYTLVVVVNRSQLASIQLQVEVLRGHTNAVYTAIFSDDGFLVLTASYAS